MCSESPPPLPVELPTGCMKRAIFSNNFSVSDFPPEEDVLRQKYIRLKIFSIKFSRKKILIVEVVNATVGAL